MMFANQTPKELEDTDYCFKMVLVSMSRHKKSIYKLLIEKKPFIFKIKCYAGNTPNCCSS